MRITESKLRQLIRESILLTEAVTLEEAETTAKNSIMGAVRGKLWEMERDGKLVDLDEEQTSWLKKHAQQFIAIAVMKKSIRFAIGSRYNNDLPEDRVGDAVKWTHNQLFEKMKDDPARLSSSLEKAINKVVAFAKLPNEKRIVLNWEFHPVINEILASWFFVTKNMHLLNNFQPTIENYYQMLRFIEPAEKRNIHRVGDIKELAALVIDATPRYQDHDAKRKDDPESISNGTEILLDDDSWWIGAIHNCEAAHYHAKCSGPERGLTLWCTAAPGVGCKFFKRYYRDDDPLIIFKDKRNQTGYQFSFSSDQFMNVSDKFVGNEKKAELIGLLASIENKIKPSYVYIHNAISGVWP
jgi:hypothetical protein